MKIGIVGAMAQEVEILSQLMTDKKETNRESVWSVRNWVPGEPRVP